MKYFIKIFSYAKPYKLKILFSLICSFLFVLLNTASLWMIGTLLSTILNPGKTNNTADLVNKHSIIIKLENSNYKIRQKVYFYIISVQVLKLRKMRLK